MDILAEVIHDKLRESSVHVNILILFPSNLVDFEDAAHTAIKHKLDVRKVQNTHSIKVKQVKKKRDFFEELRLREDRKASEKL